jgi:hypothetical protein
MRLLLIKLLLTSIIILSFFIDVTQAKTCKGVAGDTIVKAYALAVSYPDNVPEFVLINASQFHADGDAIRCGSVLASQLRSEALTGPSPNAIREHAAKVAGQSGRPDLGPKIADDMISLNGDFLILAAYFQNLVDTLPAMLTGDITMYRDTLIYKNSKTGWGIIENSGLLPQKDIEAFRDLTMELSEWYAGNFVSLVP